MYTMAVRVNVTPGRVAEYDAISEQFIDYLKTVPGLVDVQQFEDLSYPGMFWLAITLESWTAAKTLVRSASLTEALAGMPQGVFTVAGQVEGWQSVARSGRPTRPGYGFTVLQTIKGGSGVQQGFEQTMREVITQFERHGHGLQSATLARLAGSTTRYLFHLHFDGPRDAEATLGEPAIQQLAKDDPAGPYMAAPYEIVLSEIIRVAVGQTAAVAATR